VGFTSRIALLLDKFYCSFITVIKFFIKTLLLALALLNLQLCVVDVLLVIVDKSSDLISYLDDTRTGFVCDLENIHDKEALLETIYCAAVAEKLLVLDAEM
jgi:hypothetical protein